MNKNEEENETIKEEIESGVENDVSCGKCEEYKTGWIRALADYDNLKKDLFKEKVEMRSAAVENSIHQVLPVLDNFDQAVKFTPEGLDKSAENWLAGIMHVRKQLEDIIQDSGAVAYGEAGEQFDPNLHDAATEKTVEEKEDQEILEIVQRGWKIADKIIRPAKVIVNNKNK